MNTISDSADQSDEFQSLLDAVANGDAKASEELFPLVYGTLHEIASNYMNRERGDHTLQPTALIHETFLKLSQSQNADQTSSSYQNLNHFVATAAKVMRQILVNHAKGKKALKRGGDAKRLHLDEAVSVFAERSTDLLALDEALQKLACLDQRQHHLVELHFFGGMSMPQCAEFLGISERTAYYEWSHARSWLKTQLKGGADE